MKTSSTMGTLLSDLVGRRNEYSLLFERRSDNEKTRDGLREGLWIEGVERVRGRPERDEMWIWDLWLLGELCY